MRSKDESRSRRIWLKVGFFPLVMIAVVAVALIAYVPGKEALLAPAILLPAYGISIVLERMFPFAPRWNRPWRESGDDGLFFLLAQPALFIAELAAFTVATWAAVAGMTQLGSALWPAASSPLYVQVPLALLISEFGPYWYHRMSHESGGLLWRLHAVHHAPTRLYSLNFARLHPLNILASKFLALLPLVILGVPAEVIFVVAVIQKTHSLLSHTNFDFRLGPLNWVFSMAELHRLHHARDIEEANGNYGSTLIVWDVLFGTRIAKPKAPEAHELGIRNPEEVPNGVWRQIGGVFKVG